MPDWCLDRDKAGHYRLQAGDQVARRAIVGGAGLVVADGKTSTAGCVAVARDDLISLLGLAEADQYLSINPRLLS